MDLDQSPTDLDAIVRQVDPDRWLGSRLVADPQARADLIALYALDHELARIPQRVREAMMAEIRLTWWRERLEQIFAGHPGRDHPVLLAVAGVIHRRGLPAAPFEAMVEGRLADIDGGGFADAAMLGAYAASVAGAPLALALEILGQGNAAIIRPAALAATIAALRAEGGQRLPPDWSPSDVRQQGREALARARVEASGVSVAAFPAVAHLALLGPRLGGRAPGALESRARMTWASLTGRV